MVTAVDAITNELVSITAGFEEARAELVEIRRQIEAINAPVEFPAETPEPVEAPEV